MRDPRSPGFLYISQNEQDIGMILADNNQVLKPGRTFSIKSRMRNYPKGSIVLRLVWVINMYEAERHLLEICRLKFIHRRDRGREYFECKLWELQNVLKVVAELFFGEFPVTTLLERTPYKLSIISVMYDESIIDDMDPDERSKLEVNEAYYMRVHHSDNAMDTHQQAGTSDNDMSVQALSVQLETLNVSSGEVLSPTEVSSIIQHNMSSLEFYLGMNPRRRKYNIVYCAGKCVELIIFKKCFAEHMSISNFQLDEHVMKRLKLTVSLERMCRSCKSLWKGVRGKCSECEGARSNNRGATKKYIVGMRMIPC